MFKKAVKENLKLRMAICGPAGSGKTYSALAIATAMGGKIAVVDTEHGSASKYADIFNFDVVEPEIFDPRQLIATIKHAEKSGYAHIIIDSLSHYWSGKGGELEMVDAAAARSKSANTFMAWKTVTPVHNELIDTIISCKINVFATMRTKTEYVIEANAQGRQVPRKVGLAPVMREGIEYEFDLCGDIDQENNFVITKSRCPELSGKAILRPGKEIADALNAWLASGEKVAETPAETPAVVVTEKKQATKPVIVEQAQVVEAEVITPKPFVGGHWEGDKVVVASVPPKAFNATNKSGADIAEEIKIVRDMAREHGCKTAKDFANLMQKIIGRNVQSASALSETERVEIINFFMQEMGA